MNEPEILLKTIRNNVLDCAYWGSFFLANSKGIYKSFGLKKDTLVFMRSLAKPLQASIMADTNIVSDFKLTQKEIALFCASHAGSKKHTDILKNTMKRFKLKQTDLLIEPDKPLDLRGFDGKKTKLKNNCSAKHILMLLECKYLNLDLKDYTNPNHPLQKLILKKQNELSGFNSSILSFDGCGTPLWALPFENIIKAYFNLLKNEKYNFIFESVLKYPDLFGGYQRLDSEIIKLSKGKLFSKVGAGGFVVVYNFKKEEILLLKLTLNNNEIRRIILFDILNKLNWLKTVKIEFELNQKNEKVAKYCYTFNP